MTTPQYLKTAAGTLEELGFPVWFEFFTCTRSELEMVEALVDTLGDMVPELSILYPTHAYDRYEHLMATFMTGICRKDDPEAAEAARVARSVAQGLVHDVVTEADRLVANVSTRGPVALVLARLSDRPDPR